MVWNPKKHDEEVKRLVSYFRNKLGSKFIVMEIPNQELPDEIMYNNDELENLEIRSLGDFIVMNLYYDLLYAVDVKTGKFFEISQFYFNVKRMEKGEKIIYITTTNQGDFVYEVQHRYQLDFKPTLFYHEEQKSLIQFFGDWLNFQTKPITNGDSKDSCIVLKDDVISTPLDVFLDTLKHHKYAYTKVPTDIIQSLRESMNAIRNAYKPRKPKPDELFWSE